MEARTPGNSDKGFSRREIIALAGAATAAGTGIALPAPARARGSSAAPLAQRRNAILGSSRRTSRFTVADGSHPLEPLSAGEINQAFAVIEADARFPSGAVFPIVELKEPPKQEVLAWSPGRPSRREAFANVYDPRGNDLFEVVVDLRTKRIASWVAHPGREPAIYADEYDIADGIVRADARWQHAMHIRGIDPDDVYLDGWAPGAFPIDGVKPGARLLRQLSFFRGQLPNPYDRPIEGVVATVDMNAGRVVELLDTGIRPVNRINSGSSRRRLRALRPLIVTQPDGPSFHLDGHAVAWQQWHFRLGFSWREGLLLYQIGYEENGKVRPIIYRLSMNEIFVPYAIPDPTWAWRAAFDIGEYNLGQYAEPLQHNVDVPGNAVFIDEVGPSDTGSTGGTLALPHAIALYERDAGVLWDRTDPTSFVRDARFARELVVTAAYVNGNYTYANEYVFRMDGGIDVRVIANGTTLNQGVRSRAAGERYGSMVARDIAAPIHQHFFNFRIDFDIDGTRNVVVEENLHRVPSKLGNAFVNEAVVLEHEQHRDLNAATYRRWKVTSSNKVNPFGTPTAYGLEPLDTTRPYAAANFPPLERAAFATHPFWVTRYRDGELHSSGDYPNQGPSGEGLPEYVAGRHNIVGEDIVVWYTTGFTHLPTVENYPVMSSETIGFSLRPDGFFGEDPALDAP
jgi:primary-amine oxidase